MNEVLIKDVRKGIRGEEKGKTQEKNMQKTQQMEIKKV